MVRTMNEIEILNAALAVGWVKFSYFKSDGTRRLAIGTRNRALIEQVLGRNLKDNGSDGSFYRNCNGYFDLTRVDWRQFKTERFIGLELDRLTNEQATAMAFAIAEVEKMPIDNIFNLRFAATNLIGESMVNLVEEKTQTAAMVAGIGLPREVDEVDEVIRIVGLNIPSCSVKISEKAPQKPKIDRAALKAELAAIRNRETEILNILLAD